MRRQVLWSALAVAAVTLIAGLIAGAVINRRLVDRSEAELQRQANATATLIVASLRDNVPITDASDLLAIPRTLEVARAVGGHDYVEARLIGADGLKVGGLVSVQRPLFDSLGPDPPVGQVIETEVGDRPVLAYVSSVPLSLRNERARVLIAIGRTEPLLNGNLLAQPLAFSLGIGAVLAVILATWVARRVGRRLDRLGDAAAAITMGDFSVRAPVEGSDDVSKLGVALNEMTVRLEDSRRRERDFLMSVGHDLRTPLTTLRGYAEALDGGEVEPGDMERIGGVLRSQTERLSRLVEDLMLLARLEAREFTWRPEEVDLAAHLQELIEAQQARAATLRVTLVPELDDVGAITVDPDRIGQIVGNLLDNALRYTPEGGTVRVGLGEDDGMVRLTVSDTGPGIDPEDVQHVFERLYVAQRYRPMRPEGSGLGLSIVKELIDAIGGSIDVESSPGRGTTVIVRLPRRVATAGA
jgi:signal transduction histidine kinase